MKPLVIYHSPCVDGFTAAWAVAKAHGGPEFVDLMPTNYGSKPDMAVVKGRDVIIVDFSYDRDTLLEMRDEADSLLVLDHHKTAAEDLKGLDFAHFDMERSGAAMAWDFFHPETKRPPLVEYVQDRDLWTKKLPHIGEVSAAIGLTEQTYVNWELLNGMMLGVEIREVMSKGATVLEHRDQLIGFAVEGAGMLTLDTCEEVVPGVVCEPTLRSDVGNLLLGDSHHYSVTFRESQDGFTYSLRSADDRMDVGAIAKRLRETHPNVVAGGGHRNAAGFKSTVPIHTWVVV